ncbi:hypothetical protein TNCV_156251 [Trichonephila clavipes]|nr:hypothetical protein TNCV_156251 [Trichonephila clavipes]
MQFPVQFSAAIVFSKAALVSSAAIGKENLEAGFECKAIRDLILISDIVKGVYEIRIQIIIQCLLSSILLQVQSPIGEGRGHHCRPELPGKVTGVSKIN